jgi:chromosome segregation ATPase
MEFKKQNQPPPNGEITNASSKVEQIESFQKTHFVKLTVTKKQVEELLKERVQTQRERDQLRKENEQLEARVSKLQNELHHLAKVDVVTELFFLMRSHNVEFSIDAQACNRRL